MNEVRNYVTSKEISHHIEINTLHTTTATTATFFHTPTTIFTFFNIHVIKRFAISSSRIVRGRWGRDSYWSYNKNNPNVNMIREIKLSSICIFVNALHYLPCFCLVDGTNETFMSKRHRKHFSMIPGNFTSWFVSSFLIR